MYYDASNTLNKLLVDAYNSVNRVEEKALKKTGGSDLSITEFHILESVAASEADKKFTAAEKSGADGRTIGEIAASLSVTMPTVTVAVSRLEKKGYVVKSRGGCDGRQVYITLTKQGRRMNAAHRYFHETMVREICRGLSGEEIDVLIKSLIKLGEFLKKDDYHSYHSGKVEPSGGENEL